MKIVHINTNDSGGGAAIACLRHCEAMRTIGYDSSIVVMDKNTDIDFVKRYRGSYIQYLFNRVLNKVVDKYCRSLNAIGKYSILYPGLNFSQAEDVKSADVIIIHWINNGTISLRGIEEILKLGKPTYWYMHDMYPITGGCHHSFGCNSFMASCETCSVVRNAKIPSFSKKQLTLRSKRFAKYNKLSFIAPSRWLARLAEQSLVSKNHNVYCVPNVINTEVFKPTLSTKSKFGLNPSKKTILFGNASLNSPFKGIQYTIDCLKQLNPSKYEALIVGGEFRADDYDIKLNVVSAGFVRSTEDMVEVYNACDAFLISSVAENYPNVVLEAMACGKPCVGFPTGGIPDLICHKTTGYLTDGYDSFKLAEGLEWLFSDQERYIELSSAARRQVLQENSYSQLSTIYKGII